jgi:hypothetical protein
MSLVRPMPTICCRRAEPPEPGIWPSFCSGNDTEVARERQFEAHTKTEATVRRNHRLRATRRRGDVPCEFRHMLWRCFEKALDIATAREVFAVGAHDDHPHALVFIQRFECGAQLVAGMHRNDVQRRPMQDDVGALTCGIDLDREAIELLKQRLAAMGQVSHFVYSLVVWTVCATGSRSSSSYSPADSLRRRILPTGDFGISSTNT